MMNVRKVQVKGVISYLVLTYGLTLIIVAFILFTHGLHGPSALGVYGIMLAPAFSAFIVRKFITKEGFKGSGLCIGLKRYYIVAYILPVLIVVSTYVISIIIGYGKVYMSESELMEYLKELTKQAGITAIPKPPMNLSYREWFLFLSIASLTAFIPIAWFFGFGEEYGWRGYLLPKLLPLGRWRALILTGFLWWLWHTPLMLIAPTTTHARSIELLALTFTSFLATILVNIVFAWIFYASRSIFAAALAHASYNQAARALTIFIKTNSLAFNTITVVLLTLVVFILHKFKQINKIDQNPMDKHRSVSSYFNVG